MLSGLTRYLSLSFTCCLILLLWGGERFKESSSLSYSAIFLDEMRLAITVVVEVVARAEDID